VEEILVNRKDSEFQFIDNKLWSTVRGVREERSYARETIKKSRKEAAASKPTKRHAGHIGPIVVELS
jgi:hypothetical protein